MNKEILIIIMLCVAHGIVSTRSLGEDVPVENITHETIDRESISRRIDKYSDDGEAYGVIIENTIRDRVCAISRMLLNASINQKIEKSDGVWRIYDYKNGDKPDKIYFGGVWDKIIIIIKYQNDHLAVIRELSSDKIGVEKLAVEHFKGCVKMVGREGEFDGMQLPSYKYLYDDNREGMVFDPNNLHLMTYTRMPTYEVLVYDMRMGRSSIGQGGEWIENIQSMDSFRVKNNARMNIKPDRLVIDDGLNRHSIIIEFPEMIPVGVEAHDAGGSWMCKLAKEEGGRKYELVVSPVSGEKIVPATVTVRAEFNKGVICQSAVVLSRSDARGNK